MSGTLCRLCSERQRARAALTQSLVSALLARALVSKPSFPELHYISITKHPLTLKPGLDFLLLGLEKKCIITNSSWGAIS